MTRPIEFFPETLEETVEEIQAKMDKIEADDQAFFDKHGEWPEADYEGMMYLHQCISDKELHSSDLKWDEPVLEDGKLSNYWKDFGHLGIYLWKKYHAGHWKSFAFPDKRAEITEIITFRDKCEAIALDELIAGE